jgi:hypothetical protein
MIYWLLRPEQLCDPDGPRGCGNARDVLCHSCGCEWEPLDVDHPDPCPECNSERFERLPCSGCELVTVSEFADRNYRLQNALTLFEATNMGLRIDFGELSTEQFKLLRMIRQENKRLENDNARRTPPA